MGGVLGWVQTDLGKMVVLVWKHELIRSGTAIRYVDKNKMTVDERFRVLTESKGG